METLQQRYGIEKGSVISAVDLIKGIGTYAGLRPIAVQGATGLFDTNYQGKCDAAIKALTDEDFVFLHIEAPDEAGHEGDVALKIRTIEDLDKYVVGPILDWAIACNYMTVISSPPVSIALLPDHPTPCDRRTHTNAPVPVTIYNPYISADAVSSFNEQSVRKGALGTIPEGKFMDLFMGKTVK
jgi:2,3-bisphosphoglycerate-independent phosphoglycerate mutase